MDEPDKWTWSSDEIRRVGYRVVDLIAEHLTTVSSSPVFRAVPDDVARAFAEDPVPESGTTPDEILDRFRTRIAPYPFGNGHRRFFGWVNSPPGVMGIFAEALAATMNPSCAGGNHAAIYVEKQVARWFKQILDFPDQAFGLLVSGGSMAALTALAVARHVKSSGDVRRRGLQGATSKLIFYKTAETHGCHQKALELLGVGADYVRTIEHDANYRMRPAALAAAFERDRSEGHNPAAVIATAGTVNTGAIDPLDEIAAVCREHDVWLHVDGAYGAPAVLSPQYEHALRGLRLADSVALDPHKWLCVPVEAGLVLIRHPEAQRDTFSLVPAYLRTDVGPGSFGGPPWFSEFGFQQTRGFRALKVWMLLQHHGIAGYRRLITRHIELADYLAARLLAATDFEVCTPRSLSIVCFRFAPRESTGRTDDLNALNKHLLGMVQLGGRVFVSSTEIGGTFWLRACLLHSQTTEADLDLLVEEAREAGVSARNRP